MLVLIVADAEECWELEGLGQGVFVAFAVATQVLELPLAAVGASFSRTDYENAPCWSNEHPFAYYLLWLHP